MARYTAESRERVRDAVDFVELVGARTELRRAGARRLTGLCPFHEERTPSFGIDPVEKLYHCFGCGTGGDVFSFVMATEGLDFAAALESLAERYGVELEREAEDPGEAARRVRRERLLALLERTAAWYVRVLWESAEAAPAREYLLGRGLAEGALREYRVGWAPNAWDRVVNASARAGFSFEELLVAGLAQRRRDGSGVVDRFRGRITFPLCDLRGHVLGFGARALDGTPKYLNTSDNEIFHKGTLVYGGDLARAAAARAGRVVVVEGYTDVIALHQAGVPEAVGSMGTALTAAQVDGIAKLAPRALFCQDPDTAGQEAVKRGIAELNAHNQNRRAGRAVEFQIVRLPPGEDPADVVARDGADAMRSLLDAAVPVERFQVEQALAKAADRAPDEVLAEIAPVIARLGPSVLRDELVQRVANRLGLRDSVVNAALARPSRAPVAGPSPHAPSSPRVSLDGREQTERAFLAMCVALPEQGERQLEGIDLDDWFSSPATRRAAHYLRGRLRAPAAELPTGDEPLARVIAELVIRAGELEATPAKLELEALQMDLYRLERRIAGARVSGGEGVGALAVERQRVLDAIRHRLT
jgi:DNA primase